MAGLEGERQHVEGEVRLAPTLVFSHALKVDSESKNIIGGAVDVKADLGVAAMITSYKTFGSKISSEEELKTRANKLTEFVSKITGDTPRQISNQFEDQLPQLIKGDDFDARSETYSVVKKIHSGDNTYVIVATFNENVESLSDRLIGSDSLIKIESIPKSSLIILTYQFQQDNQIIISSGMVNFPSYSNKYLENVPSENLAQAIMETSVSAHQETVNRHLQRKETGERSWAPEPFVLNILAVDFTKREVKTPTSAEVATVPEKNEQKDVLEVAKSIMDNYQREGGPDYPQLFSDIYRLQELQEAGLTPEDKKLLSHLGEDKDVYNKWLEIVYEPYAEGDVEEIRRFLRTSESLNLERYEDFHEYRESLVKRIEEITQPEAATAQAAQAAEVSAVSVETPAEQAKPWEVPIGPAPIDQPPSSEEDIDRSLAEFNEIMKGPPGQTVEATLRPEVKEKAKPKIDIGSSSEKKPGSETNEDIVYVDIDLGVAAIFDGEGGVDAANVAKEALADYFKNLRQDPEAWQQWQNNPDMRKVLAYLNEQINNKQITGITSATIISLIDYDELSSYYDFASGNIGKSRVYWYDTLRGATQLFKDDSVSSRYADSNDIPFAKGERFYKIRKRTDTDLTLTLGHQYHNRFIPMIEGGHAAPFSIRSGAMLILASEGMQNLTRPQIEEIVRQGNENNWSTNKISQELVKAASQVANLPEGQNERSKPSDISAIVIKLK